jgi:hypothetical protein
MKACCGACWVIQARIASGSMRSLAPTPVTGMSMQSMSCGAAPFASIDTIAKPPWIPGSMPRIFIRRSSAGGENRDQ